MPRTLLLLPLLALVACAGPGSHSAAHRETPYRKVELPAAENWWNSTLPLGRGAPDPTGQAIREMHRYLDTVLALRRKATVDPAVWAIYDRVTQNMDSVNLEGLYGLVPADAGPDGTKQLVFVGRREQERYRVRLGQPGAERTDAPGDFASTLAFRPLKGPEGKFLLGLSMLFDLNFGAPGPDQVAAVLKNMVRWYEVGAAQAAGATGRPEGLGPEDMALLRRFSGSFPETYPWAMSLLQVDDLAWVEQRAGRRVTQVRVALRPNLEQFALRYPKIHRYLVQSQTMRDSRFTVRDAQGRVFTRVRYTGEKLQVVIRAALAGGALVPLEGPATDVSLDVDRPGVTQLLGSMDVEMRYWGLQFRLEDMRLPIRWIRTPQAIAGEYRLRELPRKIEVSGRLLGVLPVWLVDLLIPSNLEQITRNFLRSLIQGGGGKGMLLSFRYETARPGHNRYRVRFYGELADNGFVQMQTRLFKMRFAPRREARGEIGDLVANVVRSLKQDLEAYRRLQQPAARTARTPESSRSRRATGSD